MTSKSPYCRADTTYTLLTHRPQEVAGATALAYRNASGEELFDTDRCEAGRTAFIAASGDPGDAPDAVRKIVAAAARNHSEWSWQAARLRVEAEERCWRGQDIWPPLMDPSLTPRVLPN